MLELLDLKDVRGLSFLPI